jgi:four helix bundle protein
MAVQCFEDLIAWQKARLLVRDVYAATRDGDFSRDFAFRDQMRRATVSIMSNIAEGFELRSRPQFRKFLGIAKGSCAEVRSLLYAATDIGYLKREHADRLLQQAVEVARIIGGLQASIASTRNSELGTRNSLSPRDTQ